MVELIHYKNKAYDILAEIESDKALIQISEQRTALFDRKAKRAEDLVANNALPIDVKTRLVIA